MSVWKYSIEHDVDSFTTFAHAKQAFADLQGKFAGTAEVEAGPMGEHKANMLRVTVLGSEVIVGVLFRDGQTLVQITAPKSLSWAKSLVEGKIREQIEEMLRAAGATYVEIEEYS